MSGWTVVAGRLLVNFSLYLACAWIYEYHIPTGYSVGTLYIWIGRTCMPSPFQLLHAWHGEIYTSQTIILHYIKLGQTFVRRSVRQSSFLYLLMGLTQLSVVFWVQVMAFGMWVYKILLFQWHPGLRQWDNSSGECPDVPIVQPAKKASPSNYPAMKFVFIRMVNSHKLTSAKCRLANKQTNKHYKLPVVETMLSKP